jgi:hypothetical protein
MAAGLGFKTFNTGDVLSAADVNGYLMQGILVFASAAARDAAITSPEEGQFAFLKDTNVTTYYTGSAWANVDTTGMTNPMTTTGDVIYSSSGSTPARLGIGTAGQVLKVNSGATAPEWGAAGSAGALTLVKAETAFSAVANTGTTFDGVFTSTYNNYLIILNKTLNSVDSGSINFNMRYSTGTTDSDGANTGGTYVKNSSGTDFSWYFNNATTMKLMTNQNSAGRFGTCNLWIGGLSAGSASRYQMNWQFAAPGDNSFGNGGNFQNSNGTERIWTGFILTASSGTISGTATVYGFGKA